MELHPDRQAMLDAPERPPTWTSGSRARFQRPKHQDDVANDRRQSSRKQRPSRYQKDFEAAEQRRQQAEAKTRAREARVRDRKTMAKAKRPGKDGKLKLGRQGKVLLNRLKAMADEGKI